MSFGFEFEIKEIKVSQSIDPALGLARREVGEASGGDDEGVGLLEHLVAEELLDVVLLVVCEP
tara:strand:+ start:72 stop:260 length:189 start_codon:yes stop_codon:yes gene_type:complete